MRHFIRHPVTIPIEVSAGSQSGGETRLVHDLSVGGLSFDSAGAMSPGAIVSVRIPFVEPPFESKARVVWCSDKGYRYELGVQFLDPEDAFRARMVEQVCHIEEYRRSVQDNEGRALTPEQAAAEWIERYAQHFPKAGPERSH